ncbi:hypothetical protein [Cesiribacter andamanensis]|uniref:Uncharacterized protein n=1 Tax=Cesiribacter andamanensis AMV16 TaxID=1279009 RepID=M7P0M8_9BACT|nr:hypothetical protein [Cesiribacter andamanensis]EMR04149.1 hypothetical protein ADICEAN_00673 [Cesiribacter andamanensis AMV16]
MHTSFHHLPALEQQQLEQALELIKALVAPEKVLLLPQPALTGIDTNVAPVPYPYCLDFLVLLEKAGNAQRSELQEKLKTASSGTRNSAGYSISSTQCHILLARARKLLLIARCICRSRILSLQAAASISTSAFSCHETAL